MNNAEKDKRKNLLIYGAAGLLILLLCIGLSILIQQFSEKREPSYELRTDAPADGELIDISEQAASEEEASAFDPLQEVEQIQRRLNNIFSAVRSHGGPIWADLQDTVSSSYYAPADFSETSSEYIVVMDVPGVDKRNLDIELNGLVLKISGERKPLVPESLQGDSSKKERKLGKFTRSVNLPGPVKSGEITASYENGVVMIRIPKEENGAASVKVSIE